jgi:hypothetical protein
MSWLKSKLNNLSAPELPVIILRNGSEKKEGGAVIRTVEIGRTLALKDNGLFNVWKVQGYEIRSGGTELSWTEGRMHKSRRTSIGYVCHESGITLSLERNVLREKKPDVFTGINLEWSPQELTQFLLLAPRVPVIVVSSGGEKIETGGDIRRQGDLLTDGPGKPVYRICSGMTEIVDAKGASQMGYIIDEESMCTCEIVVDVKILKSAPYISPFDEAPVKSLISPDPQIEIKGRFEGVIGKLIAFDKSQDIFGIAFSKRDFWMGVGIGLVVMFLVRLVI